MTYKNVLILDLNMLILIGIHQSLKTNQNPRIDWRRVAPPINSWVLCPSTWRQLYNIRIAVMVQTTHSKNYQTATILKLSL
jgi:hypothetical protein